MATLVLTTIGGALGGPIGAMLGGLLGQSIDREIFKPKGREGPRLTELKVQTSSYGTPIPQLFGTLRVAGSVIWATDLVEHRHREGGKGRPTTTSYSYTASFAVALSAREIVGVGRIWADGKLLRGAAGDWKATTGFRLHRGGADQAPDPLIASAEGLTLAPAHRGMAYAVFENMELAEFGNRIPSLTFEVHGDAGPVTAGGIVEVISGGHVVGGDASEAIAGFSAYGDARRSVIEPLANAIGAWPAAIGDKLTLHAGSGSAVLIDDQAIGGGGSARRSIAAADRIARHVTLTHYDPARDYQAGLQQASRPGAGHRGDAVELPAALSAAAAKSLVQAMLARSEVERERRTVVAGWQALTIAPGARVEISGETGQWRVAEIALENMQVSLELVPIAAATGAVDASPGRFVPAPDAAAGETIVRAFELPHLGEGRLSAPRISIAACGTAPGWRRAALAISADGGARWEAIGSTALPAIIGTVELPAGAASAQIEDLRSTLVVELAHSAMNLRDADAVALDAGANLAWVGGELLQFGEARSLGGGRWQLSRLWRGRRGSEAAIGNGVAGDDFVLIELDALIQHQVPVASAMSRVMAVAPGDGEGVETAVVRTGASITPPSPVALRAVMRGGGEVELTWVRRSRVGWHWIDGTDAPLGEETERYQLSITTPNGDRSETICTEPRFLIAAAMRAAGALSVEVRQSGDHGLSAPVAITIPAMED